MHYWTPAWHGVTGKLAYAFNEGEVGPGGGHPHLWSSSAFYEDGGLSATLAHEEHVDYQGPGLTDMGTKLGASYRMGAWRFSLVGEHLRYSTPAGTLSRDSYFAAVAWQLGQGSLRLQYTRAERGKGSPGTRVGFISVGPDTGANQVTLGYDYAFSKRTGLFVFASRIQNQARAAYDLSINPVGATAGEEPRVVAAGVRHSF